MNTWYAGHLLSRTPVPPDLHQCLLSPMHSDHFCFCFEGIPQCITNIEWWQSTQENGLTLKDVRNDEEIHAEAGWLGQQEGNILAKSQGMADGLRKSIYLKLITDSYSATVHFGQFGCQTFRGNRLSLAVCLDNTQQIGSRTNHSFFALC